jgi:hypothetical protein
MLMVIEVEFSGVEGRTVGERSVGQLPPYQDMHTFCSINHFGDGSNDKRRT